MMNGNDCDLSKLAYREWHERANQFYEPLKVPAFMQRLLPVLRGVRGKLAPKTVKRGTQQPSHAGVAAK
jgi:hypothetical protein